MILQMLIKDFKSLKAHYFQSFYINH